MRSQLERVLLLLTILAVLPEARAQNASAHNSPKQHKPSDTVGVVSGVVITLRDFHHELKQTMNDHLAEIKDRSVTDSQYTIFVNNTWDKMVGDVLLEQELKKRKIELSNNDVIDRILKKPSDAFTKSFTDSAGTFHPNALEHYLKQPGQDSLRDQVIGYYQMLFEQDDLVKSIAPKAKTDSERKRIVDRWIKKHAATADIDDRRPAFGFY
ncbi:MAG TPA: SurA N-terminal domain-containing protein [Candidatus Kapabacteria bacterium]|nr:SurA N-terminal domain-containing protein [Candidatus Kapabacteria bacterium]